MLDFESPGQVVIVGGGRWARIVTRELVSLLPAHVPITIVTNSQVAVMQEWVRRELAELRSAGAPIVVRLDVPTSDGSRGFGIAIVVNRPSDHFATATYLIKSGYDVLVEKPFTIDPLQARELVDLGKRARKVVAAGLVFRHASYFDSLLRQLPFPLSEVDQFELLWSDPAAEMRHGEVKRLPTDISLVFDVLPHAWSILDRVFGATNRIAMQLGELTDRNLTIEVLTSIGRAEGKIRLSRPAPVRRRLLRVAAGNRSVSLDFAGNTGFIQIDEGVPTPLPAQAELGGPLARMLRSFIAIAARAQSGGAPTTVDIRDAPPTGDRIIAHMDMIAAVEREFQARLRI